MRSWEAKLGDLDCQLVSTVEPTSTFEVGVVLCHGFGAPGDDLVPIAAEVLRGLTEIQDRVLFVFPAAPILMEQMGGFESRAWWPIDMERMLISIEAGKYEHLRRESPERLPEAAKELRSTLTAIQTEFGLATSQLVIGGFSQGAMLTTEVGLSLNPPPAGLCLYSGSLIKEEDWTPLANSAQSLDILQSHGRIDPILPFMGAQALRDMLSEAGHNVDFVEFHGVHTIPANAVEKLGEMIARKINGAS